MPFDRLLREINVTFHMLFTFEVALRIAIVLLLSILIVQAIGIPWWISLVPAFFYGSVQYVKKRKKDPYINIERKYPTLQEKLRSARDNTDEGNLFVFGLHKDVVGEISKVRVSSFFNLNKARKDIFMIIFLSFVVIALSQYNYKLTNFSIEIGDVTFDIKNLLNIARAGVGGDDISDGAGLAEFTDIFGEKSVAIIGDEKLEIELKSGKTEIDVTDIRPPEPQEFTSVYPEEIKAVAASSFEEQIPKEQQEIVKSYFSKIAEG